MNHNSDELEDIEPEDIGDGLSDETPFQLTPRMRCLYTADFVVTHIYAFAKALNRRIEFHIPFYYYRPN